MISGGFLMRTQSPSPAAKMTDSERPAVLPGQGLSPQLRMTTPTSIATSTSIPMVTPTSIPTPLPPELEARILAFENAAPTPAFDGTSWFWMLMLGVALPLALLAIGWWA